MDYATLTDNNGRKADFRNVIIIMTSNAGARDIGRVEIGFGERRISRKAVSDAVKKFFSPEFRNRLDATVTFNNLTKDAVVDIVKKQIREFQERLGPKKVTLDVTPAALNWLAEKGYSDEFGAREVGRLIQDKIKDFFVNEVLFGKLVDGGSVIADVGADAGADDIVLKVGSPAEDQACDS
jgi:ATP-dependent Clp protease ATP-binding subunit ClpA